VNKISLWSATLLVVAFATFPNYVGAFFEDGTGTVAAVQKPTDVTRVYAIEGMTCEGCAGHIRTALVGLPGVQAVEVSYSGGTATIVSSGDAVDDRAVVEAVTGAGYRARPQSQED
jgi:copper chaperone CopZ